MNKRQLHALLKRLQLISYWYFLIAFIVCGLVAVFALRDNNLTAIRLHNQLTVADREDKNVSGALNALRAYTYSHMNTNLSSGGNGIYPPIQLTYTYQRLEKAQENEVNSTNNGLYTAAEDYCQQTIPNGFSGRYRISCIETYITEHGAKIQPIPAALYEFDFVSPYWSPDLAGWSLVATALFFLVFIIRFALEQWLKHRLKQRA